MDNERKRTLDDLVEAMESTDREVQDKAHDEFVRRGRLGDREVLSHLMKALTDPVPYKAESASDFLALTIGNRVVLPLLRLFEDRNTPVAIRRWLPRTLIMTHDPRVRDPLLGILLEDGEDIEVRRSAAYYLAWLKDAATVEPLAAIARDRTLDWEMRRNAICGLEKLADAAAFDALADVISDKDRRLCLCALDALRAIRDPRVIHLLVPLLTGEDDDIRILAARAVGAQGVAALDPLLSALQSERTEVRAAAAHGLSSIPDDRSFDALADRLANDTYATVRAAAAEGLGALRRRQAIPFLINQMKSDPEGKVRGRAAWALSSVGRKQVLQPLIEAVKHESEQDARRAALLSLTRLVGRGPSYAAPIADTLMQCLEDDYVEIRRSSATWLGIMGETRALPKLRELAESDEGIVHGDLIVRRVAKVAISNLERRLSELEQSSA